jgi:hypothetical protein
MFSSAALQQLYGIVKEKASVPFTGIYRVPAYLLPATHPTSTRAGCPACRAVALTEKARNVATPRLEADLLYLPFNESH